MVTTQLQKSFFAYIKAGLSPGLSLVDQIADLLEISIDSAYRRIRGEKSLSFEEIKVLSRHYNISIDALMSIENRNAIFHSNWVGTDQFSFEEYLGYILAVMQGLQSGHEQMVYYEAKDFPLCHYFQFPQLAAFKYFFWMKTILNHPSCAKMSFEDNDFGNAIDKIGTQIIQTYSRIPTVEIWSMETINSTIRQIEYYREMGLFRNPQSIEHIYDQLAQLIDHVKDQAEVGTKSMYGDQPKGCTDFQLYFNDVYLGHNTIMTVKDGVTSVFVNHGVLNFMMTRDPDFCSNTKKYFENTMKKSALISRTNDKARNVFFNSMHDKIMFNRNKGYDSSKDTVKIYF